MRKGEDDVSSSPAEVLHVVDACRHPELDHLGLPDTTEILPEQGLDRLDPCSVIGNGDLLPEAPRALGTGTGGPGLAGCAGAASRRTRRIVSTSSAAVTARAGRTAEGVLDELELSSSGSDSAITGSRCRAFRFFVWSPLAMMSFPRSSTRAA